MNTINIHISLIVPGDTIIHDDEARTVCQKDIQTGFMGKSIFGDSYRLGTIPVKRVNYKN